MRGEAWTEEEVQMLRDLAPVTPLREIARLLGKSKTAVDNKRWKLGVQSMYSRRGYHGCDDDCFHCEYPDCLKPTQACSIGGRE